MDQPDYDRWTEPNYGSPSKVPDQLPPEIRVETVEDQNSSLVDIPTYIRIEALRAATIVLQPSEHRQYGVDPVLRTAREFEWYIRTGLTDRPQ